jgi:predicted SnoaL-like aldol condensation-catalyzing enzyme
MGIEENKRVVLRQFELLNTGDIAGAAALWADESYNHGRKTSPAVVSGVYESLRTVRETHVLHEMVAEGDWVAVRTTCSGIHVATPQFPINGGIFAGLAPTGRSYSVQHLHLFRIVDGKIAEHWANRDDLGAARQIGLDLAPSTG